jgi:hypothetical protein
MHVIGTGQGCHVDQPVAVLAGYDSCRVARTWIGAGQQPVDGVGGDCPAQQPQIVEGRYALAVIDPEADDDGPRPGSRVQRQHVSLRGDARHGDDRAFRPRLAEANRDAVAKDEALEQVPLGRRMLDCRPIQLDDRQQCPGQHIVAGAGQMHAVIGTQPRGLAVDALAVGGIAAIRIREQWP